MRIRSTLTLHIFMLLTVMFASSHSLCSQPTDRKVLEQKVYQLNNRFHYDSSKLVISAFLNQAGLSAENKFYGFLLMSFTYKRLFDYPSTLRYLDSATYYASLTSTPEHFYNNTICQQAYAYFDIHQYAKADSLMKFLRDKNYRSLNNENQSKIFMQEAYIFYLQKKYKQAENRYLVALPKMRYSSPCDQPMIYGKLIELYGAQKKSNLMSFAYDKAMECADSCNILKYKLYANEVMTMALENAGEYKRALHYMHIRDSLSEAYNKQSYREKLFEIEAKYESEKKGHQITLQQKALQSKNLQIILLVVGLTTLALAVMYYLLRQRQLKTQQNTTNIERYTTQLLQKTEEDRQRIAGHLHDSINHELLNLKNMLNGSNKDAKERIDMLINDVRDISHHLHPVVFTKVGLQHSIAQLVERVQQKNNFMLTADADYTKVLSNDAELQLFRIIQEAVTNMVKHSNAIAGKISVQQSASNIFIEIKDNGHGFNVHEALNSGRAFGLHNILERSKAAGGRASIKSDKAGTVINITIHLNKS